MSINDINVKDLEGAFPVDGPVTPITHRPIEQVNAEMWEQLSISQLTDQLATLRSRLIMIQTSGADVQIVRALELGILKLELLIKNKNKGVKLL